VSYQFRQFAIPEHMKASLTGYIERGVPVGDFLTAVLENNLSEACGRADDENLANLPAYVAYLYNEAPSQCHGSPEKVRAWLAHFARRRDAAIYDTDPQASPE
jgi:hypothetical protein